MYFLVFYIFTFFFLNLVGPSCLCVFDGNKLAIGLYDHQQHFLLSDASNGGTLGDEGIHNQHNRSQARKRRHGKILIVDCEEGTLLQTIQVPDYCQLTGITVK